MIKDLSERARTALEEAAKLARQHGDSCTGPGHLIYGLTLDNLSLGNRILNDINVHPAMFKAHLKKLPRDTVSGNADGLHPLCITAIQRARQVRQKLGGGRETSTDHLLVAVLSLNQGSAHECMKEFSVEPRELVTEIIEAMGFEVSDCPDF